MKLEELLKMDLQYFAEEDEHDEENNKQEENDEENDEEEIELPKNQSELDALINKANQKAIRNATKGLLTPEEAQQMVRDEIDKEKEYSELSEEERKQREFEDERKKFEDERKKFEYDKLIIDVKSDLVERGLPATLAEMLAVQGDKEKSLEAVVEFEKTFKQALAEERKKDYQQHVPGSGSGGGNNNGKSLGAKLGEKNKNRNKSIFNKGE